MPASIFLLFNGKSRIRTNDLQLQQQFPYHSNSMRCITPKSLPTHLVIFVYGRVTELECPKVKHLQEILNLKMFTLALFMSENFRPKRILFLALFLTRQNFLRKLQSGTMKVTFAVIIILLDVIYGSFKSTNIRC